MERSTNEQVDKFREKARELECDDDEKRFNERVAKLVKPKRSPAKPAEN